MTIYRYFTGSVIRSFPFERPLLPVANISLHSGYFQMNFKFDLKETGYSVLKS